MKPSIKYDEIAKAMRRDLLADSLAPHSVFLTDREAVERYGASRITVRRAFAILEEEGLIYRVRGRGTMVNPNPGKKIRFVAFMGECLVRNGIEPMIIKGAEDQLASGETNLIICNMENSPRRAMQYAQRLVDTDIDGVILTPLLTEVEANIRLVEFLAAQKVPMVLVGRSVPPLRDRVFSILADNHCGGCEVAEHLLSLGHRRIAFFHSIGLALCSALRDRHAGFVEALEAAGLPLDPALSAQCAITELPLILRRWMDMPEPPTAVFVDNDITLMRFVEVALAKGLRIPHDISVAGFDDLPNLPTSIPHTTIHVPHYEIGRMAAAQLVDLIRNPKLPPQQTLTPVSLVIRKSTGIAPTLMASAARN